MSAALAEDVRSPRQSAKPSSARKTAAEPVVKKKITVKSRRIEVRVTPELQQLVDFVTTTTGISISDLVVASVVKEARQLANDLHVIKLTREAQTEFVQALLEVPEEVVLGEAMQRAAAHHKRLIRST